MSTLLAIAYPDKETAEKVRAELIAATKEHLVPVSYTHLTLPTTPYV